MKIAIGSLQCESNTLSPIPTRLEDFDCAYGEAMFCRVSVMDLLEAAGAEAVPALYAHALPGGAVGKDDYLLLAQGIVDALPESGLDGVWLYLHGAMYVDQIGSGETWLLRRIREKIGYAVPIALALDFHANNTDELMSLANVICGFRTVPHIDKVETERKAMRLLIRCVRERLLPHPQMARAPVIIPGDAVLTAQPPLDAIMAMADAMERTDGILCAQVFGGQAWVDAPFMGPSMVVTHQKDETQAQACAQRLARAFYDARHEFRFLLEAVEPEKAVRLAMDAPEPQVFISDSGDNTTAGAAGDNAFFLNRLIRLNARRALLAGITDRDGTIACYGAGIGDTLTLTIGGSLAASSERATVTGRLIHRGDIRGYTGELCGRSATLDCGDLTILMTERRTAVTGMDVFESVDLDIRDFKIVVVKLGYLFPGLAQIARRSILAFTAGHIHRAIEGHGTQPHRAAGVPAG